MEITRPEHHWWNSRNWKRFLFGTPALLVLLCWIVLVFFLAGWTPARTESRYRSVATGALAKGDFEMARVACEQLLGLKTEKPGEYGFDLALSLTGQGRTHEAAAILTHLAPLDTPGYPPAHLYLARTLLAQTNPTPVMVDTAETHLLNAVTADPALIEAHGLLGRLYIKKHLWEPAKRHLLEVVPSHNEAALMLASVSRSQGDEGGARGWAERAAKYFSGRVADAPKDQPGWRVGLAEAQLILKDYPAAFSNLESGWKQSGNAVYPPAIGEVCADWLRAVKKQSPNDLAAQLKVVQLGLQFAPQNVNLLQELITASRLPGTEPQTARALLNKLLAEAGTFPVVHFCLGADAWERGEISEAREHFELAFAQAPNLPQVANNMAMTLTLGEKPDFARALAIIQPVVEKFPDNPHFRDTRGQILIKLGRYQEGVKDLELALPSLASKSRTHLLLAEAYRALGLKDLSEQHALMARDENQKPAGDPPPPRKQLKP